MISIISDIGSKNPLSYIVGDFFATRDYAEDIVAVNHDFDGKNLLEAAYYCRSLYHYSFESSLIIISLIGCSYLFHSPLLLMHQSDKTILSLDIGLLSQVDHEVPIYKIEDSVDNFSIRLSQIDEAIHKLKKNNESFSSLPPFETKKKFPFPNIIVSNNHINIKIVNINNNGDVITNIKKEEFENIRNGRNFIIKYLDNITIKEIFPHFIPNKDFNLIAYYNEFDYLQFSLSDRNADTKKLFDFEMYHSESLINSMIKIEFE